MHAFSSHDFWKITPQNTRHHHGELYKKTHNFPKVGARHPWNQRESDPTLKVIEYRKSAM